MNTTTNLNSTSSKRVNGKEITKAKRKKYLQKQERKLEQERKVESQRNWILRHGDVCTFIEKKDVKSFQQWYDSAHGNIGIHKESVDGCHDIVDSESKVGKSNQTVYDSTVVSKNTSNDAINHDRERPRTSSHDTDSCSSNPCVGIISNEQSQRNNQEQLWGLLSAYHELQNTNHQHSHRVNGNKKRKHNMKSVNSATNINKEERYFIAEGSETIRVMIQNCFREPHSSKTTESKSLTTAHYDIGDASNIHTSPAPIHIISILVKPSIFFEQPTDLLSTLHQLYPSTNQHLQKQVETKSNETYTPSQSNREKNDAKSNDPLSSISIAPPFQIIIASEETISELIGFSASGGCSAMACGIVPSCDEAWLLNDLSTRLAQESLSSSTQSSTASPVGEPQRHINLRILALDRISDVSNLGSLIRSAAAFGVHYIILSQDSCDAWYRKCVRVSMGNIALIPIIRVSNLASTLLTLHTKFGVVAYASVLDRNADLILEDASSKGSIAPRWCLCLGNEAYGISTAVIEACQKTIMINIANGVDSLSVGVAGGILLHGMKEREERVPVAQHSTTDIADTTNDNDQQKQKEKSELR